jgi:DNA gyrase/topoisomerase IV subunit A
MDDGNLLRLRMVDARTAIVEALVLVGEPSQARRLVDVILGCADADQLLLRVADEWGLTEVQARAIADMQVRLLTQERRQELLTELDHLRAERVSLSSGL